MPAEELIQRNYVVDGEIKGTSYGKYECLDLGSTNAGELLRMKLVDSLDETFSFPFTSYTPSKKPKLTKPDSIYLSKESGTRLLVACREVKKPTELNTEAKRLKAYEQALYAAALLKAPLSVVTDGSQYFYINIKESIAAAKIIFFDENRELNPAVLEWLLSEKYGDAKNPSELAGKVWQAIWHATKEEPKQCLMTFVEIFILKFLSDNLPEKDLPKSYSFYELIAYNEKDFKDHYGKTQIEYYVSNIRSHIKKIFPDRNVVTEPVIQDLFGQSTLVSKTSVINGFAFLKSGETSIETFNRTFLEILGYFNDFGGLQNIDPEFKLRLYETFLKKTVGQQKLGQFFTPRNVVKAIIKMAKLADLPDGAIVLDPAAGVGGFVLEPLIEENALKGNIWFDSGLPHSRVKLIGADCDVNTTILAKANMLLHLAEFLRDTRFSIEGMNKLLAETFLQLNTNQHLGTLEYPVKQKVDVILTNPPYVTQGSKIYKEEITNVSGTRNGFDLKEYYDRCGLGLEALFLRYISGALKPGGRAFVIVPQGMLTRTEGTTKEKILTECNLLASIALPRNTFYSTPQKTYVLALERRRTSSDTRPDVFCGIATSVGESLDARRVANTDDNDINSIADGFLSHLEGEREFGEVAHKIKIEPASSFSKDDRWDVYRFWSDDELVNLGEREEAVSRGNFMEEVISKFRLLSEDIELVESKLTELKKGEMKRITVADPAFFNVRRGKRVTRKDGDQYPGPIPVYSGSKDPLRPLCSVSEEFATTSGIPIEDSPIITVNANGYVGAVFLRDQRCIIHDDVMILEVVDESLNKDYVVHALRAAIAEGNYEYEAKLYNRVKEISFDVPTVVEDDSFDTARQDMIASAYKKFEVLKQNVSELGTWAESSRIKD